MDGAEIGLVQKSYARLMTGKNIIGDYFYSRLRDADAAAFDIMKKDAVNHGEMLLSTVGKIVESLDDLKNVEPELHALGAKLKAKGLEDDSYNTIGAAWIDTLAYGFSKGFNWDIQNAWVKVYKSAVFMMQEGANN